MNAAEIRDRFREFFVARGHLAGEPASLVPAGDASVLFTSAGMQQYKPYYLGVETPPATRMTTCAALLPHQRHRERRQDGAAPHLLRDARQLLVRRLLQEGSHRLGARALRRVRHRPRAGLGHGLRRRRRGARRRRGRRLWKSHGIPDERIVRLGRGDNFWGPAGPDRAVRALLGALLRHGPRGRLRASRTARRAATATASWSTGTSSFCSTTWTRTARSRRCRKPSIDTGMGLERIAAVTQGVVTVFETDLFAPLIARGAELAGVEPAGRRRPSTAPCGRWPSTPAAPPSSSWTASLPGNEGRDYVLRRIIRRAVQQGVSIGVDEPFLAILADKVVDLMGGAYPQLAAHARRDRARRERRGGALPAHARAGHGHPRRGPAPGARHRRRAARRGRLRAARHLRLPVRPHARDRRRVGDERRRGALRAPHGGAARARPRGAEGGSLRRRPRRARGLPGAPTPTSPPTSSATSASRCSP